MSLLLTFNIFHTYFSVFYCWLWIGKCLSGSSFLCKLYCAKSKDQQMLYLNHSKQPQIFLIPKFSKYLTASSSSTYLHEKGSPFPAILPNWQYCKLGTKKFLLFLLIFLHQLRYTITERHIRNGCFCDSLFFYVSYNQVALGNSAISTNLLFLVLGIIAQTLYRSMDQCSEEVLLWGPLQFTKVKEGSGDL